MNENNKEYYEYYKDIIIVNNKLEIKSDKENSIKNLYDLFVKIKDEKFASELIEKCRISLNAKVKNTCYFYLDYENSKKYFLISIEPKESDELLLKFTDISEIYSMKLDAEKSAKSKTSFLARTSHEIRTPMNAIVGMVELILREDISDEVKEYAYSIKSAGANLLSLINDILDLSKVETGKFDIIESEYEFASIINDVINIANIRLEDEHIKLIVEFDSNIPYKMYGDEVRIRQIIVNLVNNAIKFTEKGFVKIKVSLLEKKEDYVYIGIDVEDTGIGIKKEYIESVFESFKRGDISDKRDIEGTGLGLSICKSLVEVMGGSINVSSDYGVGSKFGFKLYQKVKEYKKCAQLTDDTLKSKIIVYEPDEEYRKSLYSAMEDLNLNVEYEEDIELLKIKLSKYEYDYAFIQDEVLAEIKSNKNLIRNTKIVVMLENKKAYNLIGDIAVIAKPIYSLSIASILNDENNQIIYNRDCIVEEKKFIAPDANILIVDDNDVNLKVAAGLMKEYDFKIDTAISGYEAIEKTKLKKYEVIFMDYMMPKMDGIEATKIIKSMEDGKYKDVPIIALTANAIVGAKDMFLNNCMDDFISKPIELKKLNLILNKWIPENLKLESHKTKKRENNNQYTKIYNIYGINANKCIKDNMFTDEIYEDLLKVFLKDGKNKTVKINEYISATCC